MRGISMGKISDIIDSRLKELGIKGSKMCDDLGISRSALTELRKGRTTTLKADRAAEIAHYLGISVDYLLGRTDDPVDYEDGDILAEIPLSYVEATDGDMKKAREAMIAVENDAKKERSGLQVMRKISDRELMFALWGDTDIISEADLEDVRRYAAFVAERKKKQ